MSRKQHIAEVLSRVWQQQWSTLEQHCVGAALGRDPEQLHRLRVALRQIRALLKAFKNDLPSAAAGHFVVEFKWLAAATGAVRDLDVQLTGLRAWSATYDPSAVAALIPVATQLADERALAQRHLRRVLTSKRYRRLTEQWREFVAALPGLAGSHMPARELSALKIAKQSLRLLQGGLVIKRTTKPRQLHRLRIRGKRLRYLLESFAPLFNHQNNCRSFVRVLKVLQQELGDYRDNDLAAARAGALIERSNGWPQALPWLEAWRDELMLRKRRARAAIRPAVAAFAVACRDVPG